MGELREGVGLIHDLGELAAPEEVVDGGGDRLGVDHGPRGEVLLLQDLHPLLDGALELEEALAKLLGGQLVHGSDAPETAAEEIAYWFSGTEIVG